MTLERTHKRDPAESRGTAARTARTPANSPSPWLGLQRVVGNQAVLRLARGGTIQRLSVDDYRAQMNRKGNFTLGSATREVANKIGADWIGTKPYSYASVSEDGLHQYRKGKAKAKSGRTQANVEARDEAKGQFTTNGHITIIEEKATE